MKPKKNTIIEMCDWNKLTLDQMAKFLSDKHKFSSTGESRCIFALIEFYKKNKWQQKKNEK